MKSVAAVLALVLALAQAFAPAPVVGRQSTTSLLMATDSIQKVRKSIRNVNKENFSSTISEVEPFLLNEAGTTFLKKTVRRIEVLGQAFGETVPEGYAKDAKATQKRREKQDAFVKAKIEEAAEAAAAAAAEAEAAAAAEAAATAEASAEEEEAAPAEDAPVAEEELVAA